MAPFFCFLALSVNRQAQISKPQNAEAVWVSQKFSQKTRLADILRRFPNASTYYIPLGNAAPEGGFKFGSTELNEEVRDFVSQVHARGNRVFACLAPMNLDVTEGSRLFQKDPELIEVSYMAAANLEKPTEYYLSPYSSEAIDILKTEVSSCAASRLFDGIIVDLNFPDIELYGYGLADRFHFVDQYGMDPIDYDYPFDLDGKVIKGHENPDFVADTVRDRSACFLQLATLLASACDSNHVKIGFLGLANLYDYPVSTQSADFCLWGLLAKELPNADIILRYSDPTALNASLGRTLHELAIFGIKGASLLIPPQSGPLPSSDSVTKTLLLEQ